MQDSFPVTDATPTVPISYTVDGAVRATGISRSVLYEALKDEKLNARKSGSRTLIEHDELARFVRSLPQFKSQAA